MIAARQRIGNERGAVAVEFVLVLPLLLLALFAILEFGVVLFRYQAYVSAAREGARFAAVRCDDRDAGCSNAMIAERVQNAAVGYPLSEDPTADIVCSDTTAGDPVTVSWQQDIDISIPFWDDVTIHPTIEAVFRCE